MMSRSIDVAQLAHVAGPAVAPQRRAGLGIERLAAAAVLLRELGHEVIGEQRHVFIARAQRRHEDRDDAQPEIEVLAEPARLDLGGKLLVGRRQHPHVDSHARPAADRLDDLLLQHAQHLGLRLEAHVGDFVEEDRAAVGRLELAAPVGRPRR